ncbi:MAG: carbon-nitrogen hydrolase family protein [Candidatus Polarisedimenticolaceae bacterium]|nr:carbon-nitrogen hydrolase family protein [Candidatus Polarisedimenticolaceae bacterium]
MTDCPQQVAAIQMASGPNVHANLIEARRLIGEAVAVGAKLVVLPENFGFMGEKDSDLLALQEEDGKGLLQNFLRDVAKEHAIWLVGGTIPLVSKDENRVRAACLVYDDQGRRVAHYDKMHLFDVHLIETDEYYTESATIEPGDEVVVVDSPFGRLGVAVCYDLRFPEIFRVMLDKGVEVLALPSAFTAVTGRAHWDVLLRARAIENVAYVIAAGQGGYHLNGRETHGHSMIVDPWGVVQDELEQGAGFASCQIDLEYQQRVRRDFPVINHRRIRCE